MAFALGSGSEAAGYRLRAYDTLGSTNAEGLALARAGERGPVWIVTGRQTAGRGRRGREWQAPEGNLTASLMLQTEVARPLAASLGFVAGLALSRAIADVAPGVCLRVGLDGVDEPDRARLTLKWPNDVLGDGAKLAGILLEVEPVDNHIAVVIGLGVNVAAQPEGLPYPATSLTALGADVTAEALFVALTDAWTNVYSLWNRGHGLGEIRRLWLEQAAGLGAPVAVRLGDEMIRGTFETLDEEGRLVVLTETGARRVVAAGEVHFGAAATVK
jgi:BirA family biotin operon repressor/biotin-[acetyl-CoA-carboxylase] ligase